MKNSIAESVKSKVNKIEPGVVFSYTSFKLDDTDKMAMANTLSRMVRKGTIVRVAKGKYYKPKQSTFGQLRASERQIIDAVTIRKGERIGYVTGLSVYSLLGLTTQISNTITIATNTRLPDKEIEGYKIKFVQRTAPVQEEYIPLLQILDAIRDIKTIPDTTIESSLKILIEQVKSLSLKDRQLLARLVMDYNPATRALMGAILEQYSKRTTIVKIAQSLNSLSQYNIGIPNGTLLPNKAKWNLL